MLAGGGSGPDSPLLSCRVRITRFDRMDRGEGPVETLAGAEAATAASAEGAHAQSKNVAPETGWTIMATYVIEGPEAAVNDVARVVQPYYRHDADGVAQAKTVAFSKVVWEYTGASATPLAFLVANSGYQPPRRPARRVPRRC